MGLTVNGIAATHMRVQIPAWGIWYVDATLDSADEIAGPATAVLNDLTLSGTVLSGGAARGRAPVRIVGGRGGWGKILPPKSYANDAGVKISQIVRDAAESCGEAFDASTAAGVVGAAWAREEGPAARALELVAPGAWYVGEDGVTRLGARPARALPARVTRVAPTDPARRTAILASESLAGLLPGLVVDGMTVVDVEHEASPAKLRTTVWGSRGGVSRRLEAFQRLFAALDPDRAYRAIYEYRVEGQTGKRLNLTPARKSTGMPSLLRVPVRPGVPGCDADYLPGMLVLVAFVDGDPSRPAVVGFEEARGGNFVPDELRLAEGTAGAAREGDTISISMAALNGAASPGTSFTSGVTGTITSGSSKVKVG